MNKRRVLSVEMFFPLLAAARVWDLVTLLVDDGVSIFKNSDKSNG